MQFFEASATGPRGHFVDLDELQRSVWSETPLSNGCRLRPRARDRVRGERVDVSGEYQAGLARVWRCQVHFLEVSDTGPMGHFVDLDEI